MATYRYHPLTSSRPTSKPRVTPMIEILTSTSATNWLMVYDTERHIAFGCSPKDLAQTITDLPTQHWKATSQHFKANPITLATISTIDDLQSYPELLI